LGPGARGDLVGRLQDRLKSLNLYKGAVDEIDDAGMQTAVGGFQTANALPSTGVVDETTWSTLMNAGLPDIAERCLQLTAAFEGHGYGLAKGNFDGALLTWGIIIGFTMKSREVQQIVIGVNGSRPDLVNSAFGAKAGELVQIMDASPEEQAAWANSITVGGGLSARTLFAND
jgi:hypothetical protein